jgi:hypothetical protein
MDPANRRTRRGSCEWPEHFLWLPENLPRARFEPGLAAAVGFHSPRRSPVDQRLRAVAQLGSALDWGSRGRRFKSCQPDRGTASDLRIRSSEAVLVLLQASLFTVLLPRLGVDSRRQTGRERSQAAHTRSGWPHVAGRLMRGHCGVSVEVSGPIENLVGVFTAPRPSAE